MADDIYRARTNPGGSTAFSGADPNAFGAAAWGAVANAGAEIHQIGEQHRARELQDQNAAAGLEFAKVSAELDQAEIDGRSNAAPGAAGHTETISKLTDERAAQALGNIKDKRLRATWTARYAELKGNAHSRAYAFERATSTDHMVENVRETTRTLANGQANNPDGHGLQISLETVATVWDNLQVPDAVKEKGKRDDQREIASSFGSAMADRDPKSFLGDGKNGGILKLISPYLNPDDIDRLRTRGQAELARLEAKDRQTAAIEEAAYREDLSAFTKRVTVMADYTVKDSEFDDLAAKATKYGDKSALIDLANLRDVRNVALETRDYTPTQWASAVGELEKIAPAKRTAAQSLRLKHLQELRGPAESRFKSDPQGWATGAGTPPPSIDWENPSAEQGSARAQWNRGFQLSTGSTPALLGPQEISAFKQRVESGIAGELEVAQTMRGVFGVADGKLALQQIDKSNPRLALMINLPANSAKDYRLGFEALQRNSKFDRKELANEYFNEVGSAVPPELRGPVWDAARAIAAAELDRAGNSDPGDDDYLAAFKRGVHRALGAAGTKGGMVRWIDAPIWIPPDMEKSDALSRLSRADALAIMAAGVTKDASKPASSPYYMGNDGKPVRFNERAVEMLKQGKLESTAPGVFRVKLGDGGYVIDKNGQPWQFDIRKLK